ncbi:hypothetical protein AKJ18_22260 [Vibrio xuii]|nr:hypothetical protein AKJ18_22260 [Vibrio xuii]
MNSHQGLIRTFLSLANFFATNQKTQIREQCDKKKQKKCYSEFVRNYQNLVRVSLVLNTTFRRWAIVFWGVQGHWNQSTLNRGTKC